MRLSAEQEGGEGKIKHRDNLSYTQEEDEAVFKKPKIKASQ